LQIIILAIYLLFRIPPSTVSYARSGHVMGCTVYDSIQTAGMALKKACHRNPYPYCCMLFICQRTTFSRYAGKRFTKRKNTVYRKLLEKNQEDFLEFLCGITKRSCWERKKTKNLRLISVNESGRLSEELKERYTDEGIDIGITKNSVK
jgi:hypothetical protein